jgi:hypothetical protein
MNMTQYRRIFHCHLKKCGGTTINRWLDSFTSDERIFNTQWTDYRRSDTEVPQTPEAQDAYEAVHARASFHWTDVVYGHEVLRSEAPPGTFCFTVLREPARRVVSQVMDWRGLTQADRLAITLPEESERITDSERLPLGEFLVRHGRLDGGRPPLDNYMTRVLAAGRIGRSALIADEPGSLLDIALQSLENDYDLVGIAERSVLSRNALCAMMGLPPAARLLAQNVSRTDANLDQAMHEAGGILEELTRFDRIIYDRACQLFETRHREMAEAYDAAAFETHHAGRLLGELRGIRRQAMTTYSVRMPLAGSGFHERDAAGTPSCAVWTGPDARTTLYIPTPPNMALSLLVWILGYAADKQRRQLRVSVNGRPAVHYFEPAKGYADLLTVDLFSTGDFVRLEIDVGEATGSGELGSEQVDPRLRGICFDTYGWRPVFDLELGAHAEGVTS